MIGLIFFILFFLSISNSTTLSTADATVMQHSLILFDEPVKAEPQVYNSEAELGSVCAA
jgi:hypothetical protein